MPTNRTRGAHKRPTPNRSRQVGALAVTGVVSAGAVISGAGVAAAAATPVSQSRGWFLSGSALGVDLDDIVKLDDARAVNTGSPATVTQLNPLGVTLLNSLNVPLGPVNLLKGNGLLTLGAVNQAAIARSNGSAIGASGAVADSGAIAVGGKDGVPASNATLDLGGVLGSTLGTGLVGGLLDADLTVGAISANATQAKGENGNQVGDYRIADLVLDLRSPLLAGVLGTLGPQLTALQPTDNALEDQLLLEDLATAVGIPGVITVDVTNVPNLTTLLAAVDTTLGSGAVSINLTTGTIHVDIEALLQSLGLDLNNLPPNTELVNLILDALNTRVLNLVTDELDKLVTSITNAVNNLGVVVNVLGVPVSTPALTTLLGTFKTGLLGSLLAPVTSSQNNLVGPGSDLLDPVFAALEDLLSIRVNVQNKSGGTFTERAIQIRVLPGGNTLATVNLASASVGPGQGTVAGEDTTDSGTPLPETGAAESAPLAAAGLALMLAGAAATAGANRMGNSPAGAHAGA
uniref:choice-of-anchor G family protein n=1 Tax=Sporichthya sp. TaxID=65475 RepID=UPI0017C689F2